MNQTSKAAPEPRFVQGGEMRIAGIGRQYDSDASAGIAAQWHTFMGQVGRLPGRLGKAAYGVCRAGRSGSGFEYICGVEVADIAGLTGEWLGLRLPAARYAVFPHDGHVSAIRSTFEAIWRDWLPRSGLRVADAPFFERYGEAFDARTGTGDIEIWIPVA